MTPTELAAQFAVELIRKSGVREFDNLLIAEKVADAAAVLALRLILDFEGLDMALPDSFVVSEGTQKTIKNSGGDAAITLASLANGNGTSAGGRQAATLDLGSTWSQWWRLETEFELAATPTAGNAINLFASWSNTTGGAQGNTSGTDAAYTGYSNNIDAATKQLDFIGAHICTAQTTATVQKSCVGMFRPKGRYMNLVVDNRSGAAFHSTDTNQVIRLTPLADTVVD